MHLEKLANNSFQGKLKSANVHKPEKHVQN